VVGEDEVDGCGDAGGTDEEVGAHQGDVETGGLAGEGSNPQRRSQHGQVGDEPHGAQGYHDHHLHHNTKR
jgi:hypothetical protein